MSIQISSLLQRSFISKKLPQKLSDKHQFYVWMIKTIIYLYQTYEETWSGAAGGIAGCNRSVLSSHYCLCRDFSMSCVLPAMGFLLLSELIDSWTGYSKGIPTLFLKCDD